MANNSVDKSVVSVAEMARQCGLSRQRFHQLRREGIFPEPDYDTDTRRPFYDEEKQTLCREVRRQNVGINGKSILFYARRSDLGVPRRPRTTASREPVSRHVEMIERLKFLGLAKVTASQVEAALKSVFPNGTEGMDEAKIVHSVFLEIRRGESK